jgi:hypothetical protein
VILARREIAILILVSFPAPISLKVTLYDVRLGGLGGLHMLRQTSPRVTKCLDKAVKARQLHDAATDPDKSR